MSVRAGMSVLGVCNSGVVVNRGLRRCDLLSRRIAPTISFSPNQKRIVAAVQRVHVEDGE